MNESFVKKHKVEINELYKKITCGNQEITWGKMKCVK